MITEAEPKLLTRELADEDWGGVAELVNFYENQGFTAEILLARSKRWEPDAPRLHLVTEMDGRIVAHARALRRHSDPAGKFGTIVYVHPDAHGRGLGRELLAKVEEFATAHGATFFVAYGPERCVRGIDFAEKAGYVLNQHLFESKLSLENLDPTAHLGKQAELEAKGYRFFTLAETGDTEENRRTLYDLDVTTDEDTPGFENWGARSYEQFVRDEMESHGYTPQGVHIAAFGDEWVAVSSIRPSPIEGEWHVDYTGVRRGHRGLGLAQLLKAQSHVFAKASGGAEVSTNNDERNAPMLAINVKMGFVSEPGYFVYRKDLNKENEA